MRFFKYKCTGKSLFGENHFLSGHCSFPWNSDEEIERCSQCGKTYQEIQTVWDKIQSAYWTIVPYDWRPKNIWYQVKCWAWKRHTTYKPRYLPHTWCDKDHIIVHMNFEILCRFVEDELIPGPVDWDADEEHRQAKAKMLELYNWWQANHEEPDFDTWEAEEAHDALLRAKCKEIIDLSPWFWT